MALSLDEFTQQLTDSGLMSADDLTAYIGSLSEQPADAETLAKKLVADKKLTPFQAQHIWKGKGKSLVLGDYVISDKIGAGGMGMVFKAEHRLMKRVVALKVLPASVTKDENAVKRFLREVEAAAKLTHPNIVAANDARESNGAYYLIMECVDGKDLSVIVKSQGPATVAQAIDFTIQTARGLEYAHKNGVIHRDIKPANLLLDHDGTVKILDMGLARIDDDSVDAATQAGLTGTGTIMGTIDYMSPEQAMDTKNAGPQADIYSLGASLLYLLTVTPIVSGNTIGKKMHALMTGIGVPQTISEKRADVPPEVDAVFKKMTARELTDRYQSMSEVIADLEAIQAGEFPSSASTVGVQPVAGRSEDSAMNSFLNNLEGEQSATDQTVIAPVDQQAAQGSDTFADSSGELTKQRLAPTEVLSRGLKGKSSSQKRNMLIGGSVAAVLLLGAIIWGFSGGGDTPGQPDLNSGKVASGGSDNSSTSQPEVSITSSSDYALEFDGVDDHVDVSTLQYPSGTITMEAFVKPESAVEEQNLFGFDKYKLDADVLKTSELDEAISEFTQQARKIPLVVGRWQHVCKIFDGKTLRTFVEGRPVGTHLIGFTNKKPFRIGFRERKSHFHGRIDELRISRTVRYPAEGFEPPDYFESDEQTIALYHFDEGSGDILNDSSGNGHHGKIVGAKWVKADAHGAITGSAEYALRFNKFSDLAYVEGLDLSGRDQPFTYEFWLTGHEVENDNELFTSCVVQVLFGSGGNFTLNHYEHRQKFLLVTWTPKDQKMLNQATEAGIHLVSQSEPMHIAVVWDGKQVHLFVNGRLSLFRGDGSEEFQEHFAECISQGDPFIRFGGGVRGEKGDDPSAMNLHAVRISSSARYTETFQPPRTFDADEETLALYRFDSGSGDVLKDSSGNGHHGKIVGAKWVKVDVTTDLSSSVKAPPLAVAPFDEVQAKAYQREWADYLGEPVEKEVELPGGEKMYFMLIPPGEFMMGSSEEEQTRLLEEAKAAEDKNANIQIPYQGPQHRVRVTRPFYLSKFEVTQRLWQSVTGNNPSNFKDNPSHPVEMVNWEDIQKFLVKLIENASTDQMTFALPTEAQWEYACRAGTTTPWHSEGDLSEYAWFKENAGSKSHPVGQLKSNAYGLFDMHGNVWELCTDFFHPNYHSKATVDDPTGTAFGKSRVRRGGGWLNRSRYCYSASRLNYEVDLRDRSLGFRVAMTIDTTKLKPAQAPPESVSNFALEFENSSRVKVNALTIDWKKPFTVETNLKFPRDLQTVQYIFKSGGMFLRLNPALKWDFGASSWAAVGPKVEWQETRHVAAVGDGDKFRLFVNGIMVTVTTIRDDTKNSQSPLEIGGSLIGTIDEFRVSNSARYTTNFTPLTPGSRFQSDINTLALYHCDEGQGDVLRDASGNGNDGMIISTKWVKAEDVSIGTPANPDRAAAEWVLGIGGTIETATNKFFNVDQLPKQPFRVIKIYLRRNKQVTDADLERLKGMVNLENLNLDDTKVSDAGLAFLNGLTNLTVLILQNTRVGDAGLEHIKKLTKITVLSLKNTEVSNSGLEHIKGLKNLTRLELLNTQVTDAGLGHLKALNNLQILELQDTKVTAGGVADLQKALPNCKIEWDGAK